MLYRKRMRNRLWNFNYDSPGCYFITICTKDRKNYFGEIINKKIELSNIGITAQQCWQEIPDHFSNIAIDDFVIMPNHIHGIVQIKKNVGVADLRPLQYKLSSAQLVGVDRSKMILPKIVHGYKSSVTRALNIKGVKFAWQRSYFDEFINNEEIYKNVSFYIKHNVDNWENDEFNKE